MDGTGSILVQGRLDRKARNIPYQREKASPGKRQSFPGSPCVYLQTGQRRVSGPVDPSSATGPCPAFWRACPSSRGLQEFRGRTTRRVPQETRCRWSRYGRYPGERTLHRHDPRARMAHPARKTAHPADRRSSAYPLKIRWAAPQRPAHAGRDRPRQDRPHPQGRHLRPPLRHHRRRQPGQGAVGDALVQHPPRSRPSESREESLRDRMSRPRGSSPRPASGPWDRPAHRARVRS